MYNTIQQAVDYAYQNKMRLLIEVEPDNKRIFVYCDEFNVTDFASILRPIKKITKINYVTTNQFIKYEYYPKCVKLEVSKGKVQLRFWRTYNIDLVETPDKDIYFVDRNRAFLPNEKEMLIELISKIDFKQNTLEKIQELFYNDERIKNYQLQELEINLYNHFGVIFYK